MMRKLSYAFLGFCMLLTACQQEENFKDEMTENGDGNLTFKISVPDELTTTRATFGEQSSSAKGGITNVDCATGYDLRYQLAVYRVTAEGTYVETIVPQKKVVDSYQAVTYSLRLTPNRTYKIVVWADFVKQGEEGDLHYNTGDFRNITCIDGQDKQLNDESRDAYFITKEIEVKDDGITESLVLKRPFAKVRVVTTDWNLYNLEMPDNFKITYYNCKRFTNIDAVTGISGSTDLGESGESAVYTGSINKDAKEYALNYDLSDHNRTLTVDYLMTDKDEQTPIHLTFEALDGTTTIAKHDLETNIPIQRNWLTTILGNILTVDAEFDITIDENFENEWIVGEEWWNGQDINPVEPTYDEATKTYTVSTRDQFAWLSATDEAKSTELKRTVQNAESLGGKTIVLTNDIDMSGIDWQPIFTQGETTYTVDGQGHTLRNFSVNGKFGTVYEYKWGPITVGKYNAYTGVWGKFEGVMKNLTFENITLHGRADDEVHTDIEGNPVDHSQETSYFAGCIGYTGANYSTKVNISNVHARHIRVKASNGKTTQNVGGLIGWIGIGGGDTWVDGCSVEDVELISGSQVGGLVGQIVSGRYVGIKNCKADKVTIRMASKYGQTKSGFIGKINTGAGMEISGCTAPVEVEYINDKTGEPIDYAPKNEFYGSVGKEEEKIKWE